MRPVQRRAIKHIPLGVSRPVPTSSLHLGDRKQVKRPAILRRIPQSLPSITVSRYHEPGGHQHVPQIPLRQRRLPPKQENLLSLPHQNDPVTWVQKLDPYIPFRLRAVPGDQELDRIDNAEGSLPSLEQLVPFLEEANESVNLNMLSFIGVHQGRWETLMWLMREILQICPSYSNSLEGSHTLPGVISWDDFHTISKKVDTALIREPISHAYWSLEGFLDGGRRQCGFSETSFGNRAVGQMWLVVGTLILEASDRPTTDPAHATMMSMVMYILAQMHHLDLLPASIYNYQVEETASDPVRPPTLYLLSHRILAVLSDTAWKHHWEQEMADAIDYGYELSKPRVQPQLPHIGPEIWLDLVLWACVQGSWIREAGQLIMDIESRKADESRKWTAVSWHEVCKTSEPKRGLTALLKLQIDRSRLNQSTGISIANSGISSIDPGIRTISREVVLAISEGLANVLYDQPQNGIQSSSRTLCSLEACNSLLDCKSDHADREHVAGLIIKGVQTSSFDRGARPFRDSTLSKIFSSLGFAQQQNRQEMLQNQDSDVSASLLGLLYSRLDILARNSDLLDSLSVLEQIMDTVDSNRDSQVNTFIKDFDSHRNQPRNSRNLRDPSSAIADSHSLFPELPTYVVDALLNLIVDTRQFDLGNWLIFNDDIDGGPLTPRLLDEECLQPVLLRYASASGNEQLKIAILDRMSKHPFSKTPMAVHALMGYQMVQGNWQVVESVLRHMTRQSGLSWSARDVMELAAVVLREAEVSSPQPYSERKAIIQPIHILQSLFNGDYQPLEIESAGPSRILMERRLANQLYRILSSLAGPFSLLHPGPGDRSGRAHYLTPVAPQDFKILLDAVIQHRGLDAGIAFYDQWVAEPHKSLHVKNPGPRASVGDASAAAPVQAKSKPTTKPANFQRIGKIRHTSSPIGPSPPSTPTQTEPPADTNDHRPAQPERSPMRHEYSTPPSPPRYTHMNVKEPAVKPTLSLFRSVINGVQDEYRAALHVASAAGVSKTQTHPRQKEADTASDTATSTATEETVKQQQEDGKEEERPIVGPDEAARAKKAFKRAGNRRRWAAQRARALGLDGQAFQREILEGTGLEL